MNKNGNSKEYILNYLSNIGHVTKRCYLRCAQMIEKNKKEEGATQVN